ncbi:uncharacterized protein EV422DRAFT_540470 [Fimicolochytrium jonesii]|uniref:uncharacterized protein n=1 Tax=Fimicolochytrium jonesii TaxID=1396493 RepID=UPI0022FF3232|nr:uncharacterized protein EV422DRAFT_540470 [Fimicolochytrium jonesii]KAI8817667.1 hypothetical protein EV422DRAFT_540470 [Fimicolochytrium jonesii]
MYSPSVIFMTFVLSSTYSGCFGGKVQVRLNELELERGKAVPSMDPSGDVVIFGKILCTVFCNCDMCGFPFE